MEEEITIRYNEKTGLWEKHEPFMTIDVMTEEDYITIKAAVEHYQKHGEWVDRYEGKYANSSYICSLCENEALWKHETNELGITRLTQALSSFCPHCGVKMENKEKK